MTGANAITLGHGHQREDLRRRRHGVAAFERDWFTFTLAAETSLNFNLAWDDETVDFDVYIVTDAEFNTIESGGATIGQARDRVQHRQPGGRHLLHRRQQLRGRPDGGRGVHPVGEGLHPGVHRERRLSDDESLGQARRATWTA